MMGRMKAPGPILLVAVDLDGTLLNSAKRIGSATAAVFRRAHEEHGVYVVLASARPPRSVLPYYEQLGLDTPTINYNGALVYDPPNRRVLMHLPIPLRTARGVVSLARGLVPDVLVSAEILDRWYTDRLDDNYATETARLFAPDLVAPIGQWLTQPVTKLLLLAPEERLAELARAIAAKFPRQVSLVQTEGHLLQIAHARASKAAALRAVAGELGVPREAVMAIGDNANDVDMLQWAGIAVAVGNATPEVKAVARIVTDANDAEGAAKVVRHVVLEGRPWTS